MRLLWHSVAPFVGSGYGQQTATFTKRLAAQGHELAISAYYGLMGAKMNWQGITCYPAYAKSYGGDVIIPHAIDWFGKGEKGLDFRDVADRGIIITLGDVWTFEQPLLSQMNVASWVPIDHETVPPAVSGWFETNGAIPIAMSKFGRDRLTECGLEPLYVPHGIDTSIFRPGDQAEARRRAGIPEDAFVIAMVAANVGKDGSRKAFYEQICAFGEFRKRHPEAMLALHTDITTPYGVDIRYLLSDFPPDSFVVTDQYAYKVGVPASKIADIYRSADILTNCSWGEGFGIPIVEAQACGTPVVVTDTTAMPELCGAGWKVAGERLWHDSQHAWARKPLIAGIVDAYEQAYEAKRDAAGWEALRAQAFVFAQDYDADLVTTEHWEPVLKRLEAALTKRAAEPVPPAKPRMVESDGLLWFDRGRGHGDYLGATHEKELTPIFMDLVPERGTVLDVGAHVGHWALRAAGKAHEVWAVEPNPETVRVLRKNIALNDLDNVDVLPFAAWDETTDLYLEDPDDKVAGGSTRTLSEGEGRSVWATRLDMVEDLDYLGRLDLVKLDVEGADLHALRGMRGLLEKHRPKLFIECHDYAGYYERADLEALLTELGYDFKVAYTYQSQWSPDGVRDEPVAADYLVCTPKGD